MGAAICLQVLTGPHKGTRFCIRDHTVCTIGRAHDCQVQLAGDPRDDHISRRHCLLEVALPVIQAVDLNSLNGTCLNGKPIPSRGKATGSEPLHRCAESCVAHVQEGDMLTMGGMTFQVVSVECPLLDVVPAEAGESEVRWDPEVPVLKDCTFPCENRKK